MKALDDLGVGIVTGTVTTLVTGIAALGAIGYGIQKNIQQAAEAEAKKSKKKN